MKKDLFKTESGVKINFTGGVVKQNIVSMVENCSKGACECMSDKTKAKITDMQVDGQDGNVELQLKGDISIEEIQASLEKSQVLKDIVSPKGDTLKEC